MMEALSKTQQLTEELEQHIDELEEIIDNQNILIKRLKEEKLTQHIQKNKINDSELIKYLNMVFDAFDILLNKDRRPIFIQNILFGFYNVDEEHPYREVNHERSQKVINRLNDFINKK